jgi:hypothetical protein
MIDAWVCFAAGQEVERWYEEWMVLDGEGQRVACGDAASGDIARS